MDKNGIIDTIRQDPENIVNLGNAHKKTITNLVNVNLTIDDRSIEERVKDRKNGNSHKPYKVSSKELIAIIETCKWAKHGKNTRIKEVLSNHVGDDPTSIIMEYLAIPRPEHIWDKSIV